MKVGVPTLAESMTLVHLSSSLRLSPLPISKKLELEGFNPLSVKPKAIFVPVAPVFLTVKNLVAYSKFIFLVSAACNVEEVKNGMAETWYAGAYPSLTNGWFNDIL